MRTSPLAFGFGLFLLLAPVSLARADVTIRFVQPERYTDVGYGREAEDNLRTLQHHLTTASSRCISIGETLEFEILNVDLAGQDEWWHRGASNLRVMRDITWPRMDLRFVRRDSAGEVLSEGRERVADLDYLWRSGYVRTQSGMLPYEKAMLDDWVERRFCRTAAGRPQSYSGH